MPSNDSRRSIFAECNLIGKAAQCERLSRKALAGTVTRRYSLRVERVRPWVLIGCAAMGAGCGSSAPSIEVPIAAQVTVSRVISENVPPRPPDCAIAALTSMPTQPYRELGEIQVANADPNQHDTGLIIDRHACAMGADAIVMTPVSDGGLIRATAIAYTSSLATRAAQAQSTGSADEGGATAWGAEPPKLPMAATAESSANPDAEQTAQTGVTIAGQTESVLPPVPTPAAVATPSADAAASESIASPTPIASPVPDASSAAAASSIGSASPTLIASPVA